MQSVPMISKHAGLAVLASELCAQWQLKKKNRFHQKMPYYRPSVLSRTISYSTMLVCPASFLSAIAPAGLERQKHWHIKVTAPRELSFSLISTGNQHRQKYRAARVLLDDDDSKRKFSQIFVFSRPWGREINSQNLYFILFYFKYPTVKIMPRGTPTNNKYFTWRSTRRNIFSLVMSEEKPQSTHKTPLP